MGHRCNRPGLAEAGNLCGGGPSPRTSVQVTYPIHRPTIRMLPRIVVDPEWRVGYLAGWPFGVSPGAGPSQRPCAGLRQAGRPLGTLGPSRRERVASLRFAALGGCLSWTDHPPGRLAQAPENIDFLLAVAAPLDGQGDASKTSTRPSPPPWKRPEVTPANPLATVTMPMAGFWGGGYRPGRPSQTPRTCMLGDLAAGREILRSLSSVSSMHFLQMKRSSDDPSVSPGTPHHPHGRPNVELGRRWSSQTYRAKRSEPSWVGFPHRMGRRNAPLVPHRDVTTTGLLMHCEHTKVQRGGSAEEYAHPGSCSSSPR